MGYPIEEHLQVLLGENRTIEKCHKKFVQTRKCMESANYFVMLKFKDIDLHTIDRRPATYSSVLWTVEHLANLMTSLKFYSCGCCCCLPLEKKTNGV